jgi:hypothetical protein
MTLPLDCPACNKNPGEHCFFPIGRDENGRVIIYAAPARARSNEAAEAVRHMSCMLEYAFAQDPSGAAYQWVWVLDFAGFSITHAMHAR